MNTLSQQTEIARMVSLIETLPEDENLGYALVSNLIDFFAQYYYGKDQIDEKVMNALVDLLNSSYSYIQEKVEKAILKLMVRNYRIIRKYLLLKLNDELTPKALGIIDMLLESAFSPIYFDYSNIRESQEELEAVLASLKEA